MYTFDFHQMVSFYHQTVPQYNCKKVCAKDDLKKDGYCDDDNNHCGCQWDGGDCCGKSDKTAQLSYCKVCKCLDPSHKLTKASLTAHMFKCSCDAGWTGRNCDTDINDCLKNPCKNGGICKDVGAVKYTCACKSGWGGANCENDIFDNCSPYACTKKCADSSLKGDNVCDDANNHCGCQWDGGDCCGITGDKEQFNYCVGCKCLIDALGSVAGKQPDCFKKCGLEKKYVGDGYCDDENNHCGCNWDEGDCCGTSGIKEQFDFCKDCKCHKLATVCKHGSCSDIGDSFKCKCESGWQGTTCSVDKNDCHPNPCTDFGTCKDVGPNKFTCTCAEGWSGKLCEISASGEVLTTTTSTTTSSTSTSTTSTSTTTTTTTKSIGV